MKSSDRIPVIGDESVKKVAMENYEKCHKNRDYSQPMVMWNKYNKRYLRILCFLNSVYLSQYLISC